VHGTKKNRGECRRIASTSEWQVEECQAPNCAEVEGAVSQENVKYLNFAISTE